MNATKPQAATSAKIPKAPRTPSGSGTRLREAEAAKSAPDDGSVPDDDFEHHDTIPAPTWFDDGTEASS